MIKLLLIISLIGNIGYADDVTYINQNDKAPYNGYLFTEQKTRDIRIQLIDSDLNKTLNSSLREENTRLQSNSDKKDQQIKLVMDRNDELAKTVSEQQSTSTLIKVAYFVGGMLLTYGAIRTAHEVYK